MIKLYTIIFYQPIFNLLIFLYFVSRRDIGVAIILLTILIKIILWPLSMKAIKSQRALADLQPKVEALKKEYGDKKEEMAKALMALYSKEKVSPASSCLPLLVQLPVFIALYQALGQGLKSDGFELLYSFVPRPDTIEAAMFGVLNLAVPSIALAIAAGLSQFVQAKMTVSQPQPKQTPGSTDERMLATMNKQMTYMMPALTVFIAWKLPAGLSLYWLVTNLLTILQQAIFLRKKKS